jgi:peptidoglycan/xylan/chitin deacetylase (PgdA/CDA1 family)
VVELSRRWMRAVRSRQSLILCYHGVGPTSVRTDPGFLRIRPELFRRQLDVLRAAGFAFVTVAELAELSDGRSPPPGRIALSFDDGMDDNHDVVLPILREYGLRATFYVTTGLIGRPNPWMAPDSGVRMMTMSELEALVSAGFEIGAHTVTHPDLSQLDFDGCLDETRESRRMLEESLGVPVRTFAYPFCHYGSAAVAAVRTAGFRAAVTCGAGAGSWDGRYELPRTIVTGKDGMPTFLLKLAGFHAPIFSSPPGRALRAVSRGYRDRRRRRADDRRSDYDG